MQRRGRYLVLAPVALFLLLTEVGSRVARPDSRIPRVDPSPAWRYDALLGWSMVPGYRGRLEHADFSVRFTTSSQGLRDREYPLRRGGRRRMLVLSDSLGFGWGVEDNEVFSEQLETNQPDWEFINASVPGYGSDQQYLYLRERGLHFEPDAVLVLMHENDFRNNSSSAEYLCYKPYFRLRDGELRLHHQPVPRASTLHRLDRFFYQRIYLLGRTWFGLRFVARAGRPPGREETGEGPELTLAILDRMVALSRHQGIPIVLVATRMPAEKRRLVEGFCRRAAVRCPSLTDDFVPGGPLEFPHGGHWTAAGHRLAAERLERYLVDEGLL